MNNKFLIILVLCPLLAFLVSFASISIFKKKLSEETTQPRIQDCQKKLLAIQKREVKKDRLIIYLRSARNQCQEDLTIILREVENEELYLKIVDVLKVKNGKN